MKTHSKYSHTPSWIIQKQVLYPQNIRIHSAIFGLGGRGRGHLQLHNKWQSEWSNCSLQTMILCSTLQHSTNHYCLNKIVETDKNTCLYIELIKTFPQTLIFRYLQTNTFLILSNWILKCSVNNLQWINTGKSLKKPNLLNISQIQKQFHMIDMHM